LILPVMIAAQGNRIMSGTKMAGRKMRLACLAAVRSRFDSGQFAISIPGAYYTEMIRPLIDIASNRHGHPACGRDESVTIRGPRISTTATSSGLLYQ
jgi:hypothetical protein